MSNLSTAESLYHYNCRYAAWDELMEKRCTTELPLHQLKTIRSLWWAVKISSLTIPVRRYLVPHHQGGGGGG